jgi:hypothetical protein
VVSNGSFSMRAYIYIYTQTICVRVFIKRFLHNIYQKNNYKQFKYIIFFFYDDDDDFDYCFYTLFIILF